MVSALMGRHPEIPLLSDEGLRLDSSAAVRLIVSVLKFVDSSYTHADDHGSDREDATSTTPSTAPTMPTSTPTWPPYAPHAPPISPHSSR